jgi:hypothetical protein
MVGLEQSFRWFGAITPNQESAVQDGEVGDRFIGFIVGIEW